MSPDYLWRVVAGFAAAFIALTALVAVHPAAFGDSGIDAQLLTRPGSAGWYLAVAVSFIASGPVVAVAGAVAAMWTWWRLRRPAGAVAIVLAPALAAAIEVAMKSLVGRARPITAAVSGEGGNGYPSGHVTGFSALVVAVLVVWVLQPRDRIAAERWTATVVVGFAIVMVAWARTAIGAHYASDTVGGALLGVTIGLSCPLVCTQVWSKRRDRPLAV